MSRQWLALTFLLTACNTDNFAANDAGDSGPADVVTGTIECKGTARACFVGQESCCLRTDQANDECIKQPPPGTIDCPDAQGYVLACDDETDCPKGTVCCATGQGTAMSSSCVPLNGCVGPNRGALCAPDASPSQCPPTKACLPLPAFPRYAACQ